MRERTAYRSRFQIYADILHAIIISEPAKATYLLHTANLSHERLMSHIEKMAGSGLVERRVDGDVVTYAATLKGKKYLDEFRRVEEFAIAFGIDL